MFRSIALGLLATVASVSVAQAACDPSKGMMDLSTASASKMMTMPADKQMAVSKAMQDATTAMAAGKNDDACKAIDKAKELMK